MRRSRYKLGRDTDNPPSITQAQYDHLILLLQNSNLVQGSGSASSNQVGYSMNAGHSSAIHK
ncbi:hypothetical protein A2U01_0062934, partial [Trifolium medium]|nr:hypothetical protein [Trifolium medium]